MLFSGNKKDQRLNKITMKFKCQQDTTYSKYMLSSGYWLILFVQEFIILVLRVPRHTQMLVLECFFQLVAKECNSLGSLWYFDHPSVP